VLAWLPQGVGGLAILFYFSLFLQHAPGARQAAPRGWWSCSFIFLFCFVVFYFILVYLYNTHQVLVGLPQGVSGLAILFYCILVYFITRTRCSQGCPKGMVALLFYFYIFIILLF
jgi:hypothetical protein